jgi:uncharacterized membrane protein
MAKTAKVGFWSDFRRFFLRGLATLLPTVLTIVLLVKCYEFIQSNISVHINAGVIYILLATTDEYPSLDEEEQSDYLQEHNLPTTAEITEKIEKEMQSWKLQRQWSSLPRSLVGFVIAIILVYILGRLLASLLGRKLWQSFERTVEQIPGFKQVYPYVKQVTEYLFGEKKLEFSRVVAVPYPRKEIWSIGLVTGAGFRRVAEVVQEDFLTIFIPSSPTPITGYVIYVKRDEVIDLPITIEEALRFTASGGVIVPDHQALPKQRIELQKGTQKPKEHK